MELRKRGKEDNQETNLSVKDPTNDATFRKSDEKENKSAHVLTEYFLRSSDECDVIIMTKYKQYPSATNCCTLLPDGMYQIG